MLQFGADAPGKKRNRIRVCLFVFFFFKDQKMSSTAESWSQLSHLSKEELPERKGVGPF